MRSLAASHLYKLQPRKELSELSRTTGLRFEAVSNNNSVMDTKLAYAALPGPASISPAEPQPGCEDGEGLPLGNEPPRPEIA